MDNIVLNGPNGSSINVGSFLLYDPGPDFGEADLLKAVYAENPAAEGGVLAFETINMRRMQFPMRLASTSAFSGVNGLQGWLRTLARPGATLDVQLEGVASSEAVRFDVGAGRLEVDYEPRQYGQADRLPATLKLDTQPYGYWPTMILLASSASVGMPGSLSIPTSSFVGDVPGLAEVVVVPTTGGTNYSAGSWTVDLLTWSLSARGGFSAFIPAASIAGNSGPTLIGDQFAPASQAQRDFWSSTSAATQWQLAFSYTIRDDATFRGRYRLWAWLGLTPSISQPVYCSADVDPGGVVHALASAAPIATLAPAVASGSPGAWAQASPAYSLVDLGEVALPPVGSGGPQPAYNMRVFYGQPTLNLGASISLTCGGFYLQPIEMAGYLPRGMMQPSIGRPAQLTGLNLDAVTPRTYFGYPTTASAPPISEAAPYYRGLLPRITASTVQLDLNGAGRIASVAVNDPPTRSGPLAAQVAVRYRPRFTFLKGI